MAFSGIPLPKTVADVGPGGPLVTSLNALHDLQSKRIANQYLPLTTQSEAASKLAYANLMGPQFLAKLMGNQDILANMSPGQRDQALKSVYQAGSGQGTGLNALSNPQFNGLVNPSSPIERIVNNVKNAFGFGQPKGQPPSENQSPNALMNQNQMSGGNDNSGMNYDQRGNNIVANPAEIENIANHGNNVGANSFAENVGTYGGIKEEGKEAGKIRAKDIQDLNDTYFNAQTKQSTLDDINNMLSSPEIRQIRQLPLAGRHEMGYYAKFGTPEQQQLVGRLYSQMGNIVKDSSRDFAGQFRRGEQQLLQGMKPNEADTVDTMIGKAESLSTMNQMLAERAKLTSQYMNQYHINKLQASEMADKQFNGEKIRQDIHNKLNPGPTDADIKHMAEKYKLSEGEVKKRLKDKGII